MGAALAGGWMYVHFLALGILAVFVALGLWYRTSAALFFLGFTYVFLLDHTNYLNHFYLISLVSFAMIWVPAHRAASLDSLRRPEQRRKMRTRPELIVQFAHFLDEEYRGAGIADVEVRAFAEISLKGRPPELLIDPNQDLTEVLTEVKRSLWR